jgi:ABC-type Fe3+-hydroxamate transport system substrate-binding protein
MGAVVDLVDELGAEVPLRGSPRRVVSLVPSITETVAVSAPEVLAGVTDYCAHPPDLDVPRVGGSKYPNLQAVLALAPDLVLANAEENRREDVAALRHAGIPVWTTAAAATVPEALDSLHRILVEALGVEEPAWLPRARVAWAREPPIQSTAVVCVWRRPWIVLGRDTFAGDVLRRLGIGNAFAEHAERYPRPALAELTGLLDSGAADLVVLPDEPYAFGPENGPEAFPRARCALVSGRHLTWWGPSLVEAARVLCERLPSRA